MSGLLVLGTQGQAQQPAPAKPGSSSAAPQSGTNKARTAGSAASSGKTKPAADTPAPAPDVEQANPADPSQTRKISPNEIFRDPRAAELINFDKFKHESYPKVGVNDIKALDEMAGNVNANIDKELINRVINAMISELTSHANIRALVDPPAGKPNASDSRAIHEATTNLLTPLFSAKSAKNQTFLTVYNRALIDKLTPLLTNHLIPRIQAMIILGESASPDALRLFRDQINAPNQTVWVKLWALEGIVNMIEEGARLGGTAQVEVAKAIAAFLKQDDIPWPVQLRAMEALAALRFGYDPTRPRLAEMASAAMRILADPQAKPEVRAEAARALGLMQVDTSVPKYNYALIAHAAGQLAADLGADISSTQATNDTKAKYLAALLVGPLYQGFDGVAGARDSGILHTARADSAQYVQKVFEMIKPVIKGAIELINSGQRQRKARQTELMASVGALRAFLKDNAPPDRRLVAGGAEFPLVLAPGGDEIQPAGANLAGPRAGRR